MSKTSHIHRRGNTLYFRLAVPDRFRSILKVTQFNQSLRTQDRKTAIPAAYKLASEAKTLFNYIDSLMLQDDEDFLRGVVDELNKKDSLLAARKKMVQSELSKLEKNERIEALEDELLTNDRKHKKELEANDRKTKADAFDKLTSLTIIGAPNTQQEPITAKLVDK